MHPNNEHPYNEEETRDMIHRFLRAILSGEVQLDIDPNAEFEVEIDDDDDNNFVDKDSIPFCDMDCENCDLAEEEDEATDEADDCDECPCLWGIPDIDRIIFSPPATVIFWGDGEKTVVKCAEGQQYDRYNGFCAAVCKRLFGSSSAAKKIMDFCDEDLIRDRMEAASERKKAIRRAEEEAAREKEKEPKSLYDTVKAAIRGAMDYVSGVSTYEEAIRLFTSAVMKSIGGKDETSVG